MYFADFIFKFFKFVLASEMSNSLHVFIDIVAWTRHTILKGSPNTTLGFITPSSLGARQLDSFQVKLSQKMHPGSVPVFSNPFMKPQGFIQFRRCR